jgi:hypothetical protein
MDARETLAERYRVAELAVPDRLQKAAVAVVRAGNSGSGHGSGTLLRVADCSFVVTAKHVIRDARDNGWPLGITGDKHIVETPGHWAGSPESGRQPDQGLGDVAVYKLNADQVSSLGSKEFVRLTDLGLLADVSRGFFTFLGFPVMWSDQPSMQEQPLGLGLFRYATSAAKNTGRLSDFDPEVHFLLDADDRALVNQDGEATSLRSRNGFRVNLVDGVAGISGSGIWRIGKPDTNPDHWRREDARVVGVATGVYPDARVIKATRWVFVMKLIHEAFPEVRRALELHTPHIR